MVGAAHARIFRQCVRARRLRGSRARLRARRRDAESAFARSAHRLQAEGAAAHLYGGSRSDRRIRRRAPQRRAHSGRARSSEKSRARHRGLALLRSRRRRSHRHSARGLGCADQRPRVARREHDHDAGRAQLLPVEREDLHTQDLRNAARIQDRARADEGSDSRGLYESDLSRAARVRFRERGARLLRQGSEGRHARRGRDARGPAESAVGI